MSHKEEAWAFIRDILLATLLCWVSEGWPEPKNKENFYKNTRPV